MKEFRQAAFDPAECMRSMEAYRVLLDSKAELEEATDIKPFFGSHTQLVALMGKHYGGEAGVYDLVAPQYQLFGDFGCDLVAGDSRRCSYGFIELEDATATSLFRTQGRKATPEWSSRLERGFSQLIDWCWKLEDMARTDEFVARFGSRHASMFGLLIIGRDHLLAHPRERQRWDWRSRNVWIGRRPIRLVTYDEVYRDTENFLGHYFRPDRQ